MKQKITFDKHISTYWWNMGSRKKDFEGTISEFFKEKGITCREVIHPKNKDSKGFKFKIPVGSSDIVFTNYGFKDSAALTAVKFFLTALGDRAQINTGYAKIDIN